MSLTFNIVFITSCISISILIILLLFFLIFFFKQKTAYEMRISDWSSDVCSSDLHWQAAAKLTQQSAKHAMSAQGTPQNLCYIFAPFAFFADPNALQSPGDTQ